jgi:hypothetical protein
MVHLSFTDNRKEREEIGMFAFEESGSPVSGDLAGGSGRETVTLICPERGHPAKG